MDEKTIKFYKYYLSTEVPKLGRAEKIKILTKIAQSHRQAIFESGEGTQIRLDNLPDDMIVTLHQIVEKNFV